MKRFVAVLMLAGGFLVAGGAKGSTISLSQGSGSVTTGTDSTNPATQNTREIEYNFNAASNKLTFTFPDGASFYVTDVSEYSNGSSASRNSVGIPSTADSGFTSTINAILGAGFNAKFKIYDASNNALLLDVSTATTIYITKFNPPVAPTQISPVVVFEYNSGVLTLKVPSTATPNPAVISSTGAFTVTPTLSAYSPTLSLAVPTPPASAVPTLSEWSQMLLGLMVLTLIGWHFHKQRSY